MSRFNNEQSFTPCTVTRIRAGHYVVAHPCGDKASVRFDDAETASPWRVTHWKLNENGAYPVTGKPSLLDALSEALARLTAA